MRRSILCFFLLGLYAHAALAIDTSDEDVSYLGNAYLETLATPHYGADQAVQKKCVDAGRDKAKDKQALKSLTERCRVKATPKACRTLSAVRPEPSVKSPQEACSAACQAADKKARPEGDCSLG